MVLDSGRLKFASRSDSPWESVLVKSLGKPVPSTRSITSFSYRTIGPDGTPVRELANPGAILEFTYTGSR